MLLTLQKYDIELKYIAGKDNMLADTLSHASLKKNNNRRYSRRRIEAQVHMVNKNAQATSAKIQKIQEEAAKDCCLMRITR